MKSPTGAKLVDFKGGRATYSDGSQVDGSGWTKPKNKADAMAKVVAARNLNNETRARNGLPPKAQRQRRIGQAEQRIIRARTLTKNIKDPAKKKAFLAKIAATQQKLDRQKS